MEKEIQKLTAEIEQLKKSLPDQTDLENIKNIEVFISGIKEKLSKMMPATAGTGAESTIPMDSSVAIPAANMAMTEGEMEVMKVDKNGQWSICKDEKVLNYKQINPIKQKPESPALDYSSMKKPAESTSKWKEGFKGSKTPSSEWSKINRIKREDVIAREAKAKK